MLKARNNTFCITIWDLYSTYFVAFEICFGVIYIYIYTFDVVLQTRIYNEEADACGPLYLTVGDGGNREGLALR